MTEKRSQRRMMIDDDGTEMKGTWNKLIENILTVVSSPPVSLVHDGVAAQAAGAAAAHAGGGGVAGAHGIAVEPGQLQNVTP